MSRRRDPFDVLSYNGNAPPGITTVATTLEAPGELQVPIVYESDLRAAWRALGFDEVTIEELLEKARRVERELPPQWGKRK